MNTAADPQGQIVAEEEQPVISFTQVIVSVPGTGSFSGWGPRVAGSSSLLTRWS